MYRFLIALLIVSAMIGCSKSNPTAPPIDTYVVPFSILGVGFSTPEINQHDTSFTTAILWTFRGVPDSIKYQTQIGIIVDSVTTLWQPIINDTLLIYRRNSPVPAWTDSIAILTRANYFTPKGEYWYSKSERVACITVNRAKK